MLKHIVVFLFGALVIGASAAGETLTLDQAVNSALQNSFAIKEALNHEKSTRENLKSSRTEFLPKATANYSYTQIDDAPYQVVGGTARQVGDTDAAHFDVTVVQPLFKGFGILSRYRIARAESEVGSLELEQAAMDVIRDTKTAYYEALLALNIRKVAEDQVKTLEAQEKDAQGFYDHGVIPKNDLLKTRIAKASAVQEREKARADARIAVSRLNIVMGSPIDMDLALEPVDTVVTEPGELGELMAFAVNNRPEMKIMGQGLERYQASVNFARSTCYPELSLVGRYEQNGDDPGATDNDYSNDHNASVSIQARWTFFEWGKSRADTREIRYEKQAFNEKIKATEGRIRLETKQEYLNLHVSEKNIRTAEEAVDQARENFRITRSRYLQQVTTATEVLEAQTFLSRAESDYHRAVYGRLIARARLTRATGAME